MALQKTNRNASEELIPRMIRFFQCAHYALIVNKANFRNMSEQNVQRVISEVPKHYYLFLERCQSRKKF